METTSMTFEIAIPAKEWFNHPLRNEWIDIPNGHPIYGDDNSYTLFLKQEYNINLTLGTILKDIALSFQSEQDYILWILHQ